MMYKTEGSITQYAHRSYSLSAFFPLSVSAPQAEDAEDFSVTQGSGVSQDKSQKGLRYKGLYQKWPIYNDTCFLLVQKGPRDL